MWLAYIICGNNKPYKWIERIKDYSIIPEQCKKVFFPDTITITCLDDTIQTINKKQLVCVDLEKAVGNIGNVFKIANEYIQGVNV